VVEKFGLDERLKIAGILLPELVDFGKHRRKLKCLRGVDSVQPAAGKLAEQAQTVGASSPDLAISELVAADCSVNKFVIEALPNYAGKFIKKQFFNFGCLLGVGALQPHAQKGLPQLGLQAACWRKFFAKVGLRRKFLQRACRRAHEDVGEQFHGKQLDPVFDREEQP